MRRLLLLVAVTACGSKSNVGGDTVTSGSAAKPDVHYTAKDLPPGLVMKLSDGTSGPPAFDRSKIPPATKLSDADTAQLLSREKPIATEAGDKQDFALRPASTPPPRTGETIHESFPPPASSLLPPPPNAKANELKVLRYMPEGAVKIVPELTVTFNEPMVAVTGQSDAAAVQPVKLTPQPKGKWRWIGSRTIVFDPDVRFPQATTYKVEIPAGTKSATGDVMKQAVTFSFETPPPQLVSYWPTNGGYPQKLDVPMWVEFDQKVDPQTVLAMMKANVHARTRQPKSGDPWSDTTGTVPLRMLDQKEIDANKQIKAFFDGEKKEREGRFFAFRATQDLPKDATITISIPSGTPSAEGPNKTKSEQSFAFETYPPLRLERADCGYTDKCVPNQPLMFLFDNPLDEEKFDEQWVSVTPEIEDMQVITQGNYVMVTGLTKARTKYDVKVDGKLLDRFGQTLGHSEEHIFDVGDASPTFFGPTGMVVLDPIATKPTLDFFTTNYDQLKVKLYAVEPSDLRAYSEWIDNLWNHDHPKPIPGRQIVDKLMKTTSTPNELSETSIDLAPALNKGFGSVIAIVEPYPWKEAYDPPRMISWIQSTKIAVDAHVDNDNLVAYATELATGKPLANVQVELRPYGLTGTTDDKGLATIKLADQYKQGITVVVAKLGDDSAFITGQDGYYENDYNTWYHNPSAPSLVPYVVDDRNLYKPGEEVTLKGWLRMVDHNKGGDVGPLAGVVTSVDYTVHDSQGVEIGKGSTNVNVAGGFDTKFTLPKTPNLGPASVAFMTKGKLITSFGHGFRIEEFRRPEFEVSAQPGAGPFLIAGEGDVTVSAKYYSGGPLPGAQVSWNLNASPTSFTPPNRDEYTFGTWTPWWGYHRWYADEEEQQQPQGQTNWSFQGKTDAMGEQVLHMAYKSVNPATPMSVTANATVFDVNRQAWNASTSIVVHPSTYYVGVKPKRMFVEKGRPFDLDVIGVDLDGKIVPGAKISLEATREKFTYKKGRYDIENVDKQACAVTAAKDPSPCEFKTTEGGTYDVIATITDPQGRPNTTKIQFWVTGGANPPMREVAQEVAQLIPDKKEYTPGNTAELLLQTPFYPAEGIVTWRRSGIVKLEKIHLDGPSQVLTVPIEDAMTPNLFVQVDLVGAAPRLDAHGDPDPSLPKRPAYAVGSINLSIPPKLRTLAVTVNAAKPKVAPGEADTIDVEVKDAQGKPVADSEVAVFAVDESVLALASYTVPNPIDLFYGARAPGVQDRYLRSWVKLAKPDPHKLAGNGNVRTRRHRGGEMNKDRGDSNGDISSGYDDKPADTVTEMPEPKKEMARAEAAPPAPVAAAQNAPGAPPSSHTAMALDEGKMGKKGDFDARDQMDVAGKMAPDTGNQQATTPIAIRTNFNPLAAFAPAAKTDANGKASVQIKLPDNLTRYRLVAIAVSGDKQFGKGEGSLTARLPLMVRPSPPRFLNFGDTFQLPVVVQNQTDSPMKVRVAARVANLTLTDGGGREVMVPANDRVEVQFPTAAEMAGTARLQIVGASQGSEGASDAAELALPVWTPTTTEAFATYGVIDQGSMAQPVGLPGKVWPQFGGLEVTTASTNLQALTDALLYLVHYPFECAEQRSSRILSIAALRDVLSAFKTKDMPSAQAMETSVIADLDHLQNMQNYDGGFAFWDRGHPSEPYLTVFVANALAHAKAKGFAGTEQMLARASSYLRNIENYYPWYYGPEIRHAISAYALSTRKIMGDLDIAKGKAFFKEWGGADKIGMETQGWLLQLFAKNPAAADERAAILRYALNHVSETAGAANFTVGYGDGSYLLLASDRRVDGVMLEAMIEEQPDSDLIPKIVTGLLAHRKAGRWLNTQENTFALVALDLYFHTYEKVTPDFVARVWLGNDYAGDHTFKGRTTEYAQIDVPMKDVATHDKQNVTIQKDGAGRLYYRIGMKYAPTDLKSDPADYGFVVQRKYEGADDPKDVTRAADGTWHVKAGARVRVKVTMVNENRRYHVALVDPMPGGFEALNPALAATGPIPQDPNQTKDNPYWWWSRPGTSTRTCATNGSKRSRRCCGKACTTTRTSRVPPRRVTSWCRRRRPKRCTCPKPSGAAVRIASLSSDAASSVVRGRRAMRVWRSLCGSFGISRTGLGLGLRLGLRVCARARSQ
ncbi:MAG: alpha-2-macroglobulin family protein [Kofleriaceae bacterium]